MQIHELTQRKTQVDEGFMDRVNQAAQSTKQAVKAVKNNPAVKSSTQWAGKKAQQASNLMVGTAGKIGQGAAWGKGVGQSAANPFKKAANAYKQAGVGQQAAGVAGKAQQAWDNLVANLKGAGTTTTPDVLEKNLRAFVQKNLLGDMAYNYDKLTNIDDIENQIKTISNNTNPAAATGEWNKLIKILGVAQVGSGQKTSANPNAPSGLSLTPSPGKIAADIQARGVDADSYKVMSTIVQGVAGSRAVGSTGNEGVDAFLRSLGFTVQ
jgi:hypothetical protein